MKAGVLFSSLLEKVGVDVTDEKLKDILGIQIDLPEEFATKLDTELMSKAAAKVTLKTEIVNEFTTGVYINIEKDLEALGLEKSERDEVFKDKSLGKVVKAYGAKIKEVGEKSNTSGTDKEKGFKEDIKKLNEELAAIKETHIPKEELDKVHSNWNQEKKDRALEGVFLSKKWSDHYPEKLRLTIAKTALDEKLKEMGATLILADGVPKIVKAEDNQLDYFDKSNKLVTFDSLANELMQANKFLAVSSEGPSTNTTVIANPGDGTKHKKQNNTLSLIDKALSDQGIV